MKVLILNKNETSFQHAILYQIFLERAGHFVALHHDLSEVSDSMQDIENFVSEFDYAVVHPDFSDAAILKCEVERRKDFRVLFYNVDGPSEYDGRVKYKDFLDPSQLVKIVNSQGQS
jgi:hypothetical protein